MAITTAADYAKLGTVQTSPDTTDFSTMKLAYITIVMNQLKTQLMLVTHHPVY